MADKNVNDTKPEEPTDSPSPQQDVPDTVSRKEFEELARKNDELLRGFNEKARETAELRRLTEELKAKDEAKLLAATEEKRLAELEEMFGGDADAAREISGMKSSYHKLLKESESTKKMLNALYHERAQQNADKTIEKSGVAMPEDYREYVRQQAITKANQRYIQTGESFDGALRQETEKLCKQFDKLVADTAKTRKQKPPVEEPPAIPRGGAVPPSQPQTKNVDFNDPNLERELIDDYMKMTDGLSEE